LQFAVRLGLSFEPGGKTVLERDCGQLPVFTRGHSQFVKNVLRGAPGGIPLVLFDYRYIVGYGKHRSTYQQTVAVFHLAGKSLCWFTLSPEHFFHRFGTLFGFHDINFPHQDEFSRAYFLRGKDENTVRVLFQPGILSFFARNKGWTVEGGAEHLVIYRTGYCKPDEVQHFLNEVNQIVQLFA